MGKHTFISSLTNCRINLNIGHFTVYWTIIDVFKRVVNMLRPVLHSISQSVFAVAVRSRWVSRWMTWRTHFSFLPSRDTHMPEFLSFISKTWVLPIEWSRTCFGLITAPSQSAPPPSPWPPLRRWTPPNANTDLNLCLYPRKNANFKFRTQTHSN